jgi:hypothetical protein
MIKSLSSLIRVNNVGNKKYFVENVNYIYELDKLNLPLDKYVIAGSSVLVVHNILDINDDLDIILHKSIFKKLDKLNLINIIDGKYKIKNSHIDLGHVNPDMNVDYSFDVWYVNSFIVDKYRFANLEINKLLYQRLLKKFRDNPTKAAKYRSRINAIDNYLKNTK